MGEWEAWIKAGTGDDKTEIVVIADFWERTGGLFSADRDISSNAFQIPWGGFDERSGSFPGNVSFDFRLIPKMFSAGGPQIGANTPFPHSAPNAATSPFYKQPGFPFQVLGGLPVVNPNGLSRRPGYHRAQRNPTALSTDWPYRYKGVATTSCLTSRL